MPRTVTVRLPEDLARWLERTSKSEGLPKSVLARRALERWREGLRERPFLAPAGSIPGPGNLSTRKAFSRK